MSKEMTPKDALEGIIWRLTSYEDDLELRETDKKEIEIINQALDRLELLEKIFSDSHICEIKARFNEIECSADKCDNCPLGIGDGICLKNTFEKKWELQKENRALRNKLNINFEDCADELCEALTQRDKLYDENLELQKENQELKEKISKFEKPILYMCRNRRSRELERLRLLEVANIYNVPILLSDVETVEENTKLKKVIDILKTKRVNVDYLLNSSRCAIYNFFANKQEIFQLTQQEYDLLKEVLENV